jgi:hypothetical protein
MPPIPLPNLPGQKPSRHPIYLGPKEPTGQLPPPTTVVTPAPIAPGFTPVGPPYSPPGTTATTDPSTQKTVLEPTLTEAPDGTEARYAKDASKATVDSLFGWITRNDGPGGAPKSHPPPHRETFLRFILATLARRVYYPPNVATDEIGQAIPGIQFGQYGGPNYPFDWWILPSGNSIISFPGTTDLASWANYANPAFGSYAYMPQPYWWVYKVLVLHVSYWVDLALAKIASYVGDFPSPFIFTGHSVGGVAAILCNWKYGLTGKGIDPSTSAAKGAYTFACPAFMRGVNPPDGADSPSLFHERTYGPADPVPDAPTAYVAMASGAISPLAPTFGFNKDALLYAWTSMKNNNEVPVHYSAEDLDLPPIGSALSDTLAAGRYRTILLGGPGGLFKVMVNEHKMSTYTDRLEAQVRAEGSADRKMFAGLVAANRLMDLADLILPTATGSTSHEGISLE